MIRRCLNYRPVISAVARRVQDSVTMELANRISKI